MKKLIDNITLVTCLRIQCEHVILIYIFCPAAAVQRPEMKDETLLSTSHNYIIIEFFLLLSLVPCSMSTRKSTARMPTIFS